MNIELYSVKGFTGSALKGKLEEALHANHLPHAVIEMNHVDQFIKAELSSVPAIKIQDKVFPHPDKMDIAETVNRVVDYLLENYISSILVPVDFTEECMHAIAYAQVVAQKLQLGLTLVHIHTPIYDPVSAGALDIQFLQGSNKRLMSLVEKLNAEHSKNDSELRVSAHLEVGEPSTSLIDLYNESKYELMVIGTKAVDNTMRRLFGTVSSSVSRYSKKPVIVVPGHSKLAFPEKIVVGFTEELLLDRVLDNILEFGSKNQAFFDFVHVTEDHAAFEKLKIELHERLVGNKQILGGFNILPVSGKDQPIDEMLSAYAAEAGAQLVIFVTHHRSFTERFLHTSVTKQALAQPEIPVMIFHQEGDLQ